VNDAPYILLAEDDASQQDSDVELSYRLGANGFVAKPGEFQHLIDVIRQLGTFWLTANITPPWRPRAEPASVEAAGHP